MIKLLIISDDFTGALDTGVHFAQNGAKTRVVFDQEYVFAQDGETEVIVIDAETRRLSKEEAYRVVHGIVKRGMLSGISYFYLKTDSALRGNVGSSLQAMLDAYGAKVLPFIPAYPQMNRLTIKGIQYVDNIKVEESVFGKDPFNPVRHSSVREIIRQQSRLPCVEVHSGIPPDIGTGEGPAVVICDAVTDQEIFRLAKQLNGAGYLHIMAGCAGLASVLPAVFHLKKKAAVQLEVRPGLFIASGSLNPITATQIAYAVEHGFWYISVLDLIREALKQGTEDFLGTKGFEQAAQACRTQPYLILDSSDYRNPAAAAELAAETGLSFEILREQIPKIFGSFLTELFWHSRAQTLMVTGGDTLIGFLKTLGTCCMEPHREIMPGIVISAFSFRGEPCSIITKSGGFGEKDLFVRLTDFMNEKERQVGTV